MVLAEMMQKETNWPRDRRRPAGAGRTNQASPKLWSVTSGSGAAWSSPRECDAIKATVALGLRLKSKLCHFTH
jgi:hypothetical protein